MTSSLCPIPPISCCHSKANSTHHTTLHFRPEDLLLFVRPQQLVPDLGTSCLPYLSMPLQQSQCLCAAILATRFLHDLCEVFQTLLMYVFPHKYLVVPNTGTRCTWRDNLELSQLRPELHLDVPSLMADWFFPNLRFYDSPESKYCDTIHA